MRFVLISSNFNETFNQKTYDKIRPSEDIVVVASRVFRQGHLHQDRYQHLHCVSLFKAVPQGVHGDETLI